MTRESVTSVYRAIMLEIERERIAFGWSSWLLDDQAGTQDGYFQKCLHPDAKSGRQCDWRTLQMFLDALFPDGFDVVITRKKGLCITPGKHNQSIRHIRATNHLRTQRELGRENGVLGGRIGGLTRAAKLSKTKRRKIAQQAATARWIKWRAAQITSKLDKANGRPKGRPPKPKPSVAFAE
jgi:hypothetical protein